MQRRARTERAAVGPRTAWKTSNRCEDLCWHEACASLIFLRRVPSSSCRSYPPLLLNRPVGPFHDATLPSMWPASPPSKSLPSSNRTRFPTSAASSKLAPSTHTDRRRGGGGERAGARRLAWSASISRVRSSNDDALARSTTERGLGDRRRLILLHCRQTSSRPLPHTALQRAPGALTSPSFATARQLHTQPPRPSSSACLVPVPFGDEHTRRGDSQIMRRQIQFEVP